MELAAVDGVELRYEIVGSGEAVVLLHHGAGADWFAPLAGEPSLNARYRLVRYHRAGYAGSSRIAPPLSFQAEADILRALLQHLGIDRVHLVGHSASACIAMQVALDATAQVHSLALLEPALLAVPSPPEVPRALELYRAGDIVRAVHTFLRGTCGPESRSILERVLPGSIEQALADAPRFFEQELPALRQWVFGKEDARRIRQPALAVLGKESDDRFRQRHKLLLDWLPNVEPFVLPRAGHLLPVQNPRGLAEGLADFFTRHPIGKARGETDDRHPPVG